MRGWSQVSRVPVHSLQKPHESMKSIKARSKPARNTARSSLTSLALIRAKAETEALKARCDARAYLYENEIFVVLQPRWLAACTAMVESVEQFHSAYPEQPGINIGACDSSAKWIFLLACFALAWQNCCSNAGSV